MRTLLIASALALAITSAAAESLTGQVVCSQCWFEADRGSVPYGTPADLDCAARCADAGVASALAVRNEDGFELVLLSDEPPQGGSWLDWTGRFVRAEGAVERDADETRLRPRSLTALEESPWPRPEVDEHAAPFSWTDLRGRPTDLRGLGERIVVINFWATWCRPCIREMPDLLRVHDRFAAYGVEFLGAAADPVEETEAVVAFVKKLRIHFPIVVGATTEQMQALGLPPTLPGTVVLDEHGHAIEQFPGVIEPDRLEAALSRMLGLVDTDPPVRRVASARSAAHGHRHTTQASLVPS